LTILDVWLLWAAMSLSAGGLVGLAAYSFSYEFEAAFVPLGVDVALLVDEPVDEFVEVGSGDAEGDLGVATVERDEG
jgi:hypothetical protein